MVNKVCIIGGHPGHTGFMMTLQQGESCSGDHWGVAQVVAPGVGHDWAFSKKDTYAQYLSYAILVNYVAYVDKM